MRFALPVLALLLLANAAHAQDSETRRVILTDGTVLIGTVADEDADPVVVLTANGVEQRVERSRIREITSLIAGRFTRLDPSRSRLFVSPTGRALGRGNKRFSAYYIFPSVAAGVTDRVDVSVGSTIPLITSEGSAIALNFNGKAQLVPLDNGGVAVGTSALVPIATEGGIPGFLGTVYAVGTFGSATTGVTLGVTGAYITDLEDAEIGNGAAVLVGIDHQVSNSFKLISENLIFVGEGDTVGFLSGGVRIFGDRLAGDAAVALFASDGEFVTIPVPYLGVSYNF
ncbi:MAG: hypothetical protein AAGI52_04520 [Bacteroidota bacterium]